MKKISKRLLGTLIAIVALVIALPVVILSFIDFNQYKDEIATLVRDLTGRELTIEGDIGHSYFPLGARLNRITLGNAPGFSDQPFATFSQATVSLDLGTLLLKQRLAVSRILLQEARLRLEIASDQSTNWQDLQGVPIDANPPKKIAQQIDVTIDSALIKALQFDPASLETSAPQAAIGGINIDGVTVTVSDLVTGQRQTVDQLALTTGPVDLTRRNDPVPLTLQFHLQSTDPPADGTVKLSAQLTADPAQALYHLGNLALDTRINLEEPKAALQSRLTGAVVYSGTSQSVSVDDLKLTTQADLKGPDGPAQIDLKLAGQIRANLAEHHLTAKPLHLSVQATTPAPAAPVEVSADLTAPFEFDWAQQRGGITPLTLNARLRGAELPKDGVPLELRASIQTELTRQTLTIADLAIRLANIPIEGRFEIRSLFETPHLSGRLQAARFNPRDTARVLGVTLPPTADAKVLNAAGLTLRINATPEKITVSDTTLSLDESTAALDASVELLDPPRIAFNVELDRIDVDRYLEPPSPETSPDTATPAASAAAGATTLPIETLRRLDVEGTARIGRLRINGLETRDVRVTLQGRDGVIRLHPLTARLYSGRYQGDTRIDARGEKLTITLNEKLENVNLQPLLNDLLDNSPIAGTGGLVLQAELEGATTDELLAGLSGEASLSFVNGALLGYDLRYLVKKSKAILKKTAMPDEKPGDRTPVNDFNAVFRLSSNSADTRDLTVDLGDLLISGEGKIDLATRSIDYLLTAKVNDRQQPDPDLDELKGLSFPVNVTGTLPDGLRWDIKLGRALKEAAKARAKAALEAEKQKLKIQAAQKLEPKKQQLQQKREEVKDEIEQKAKDKLKELFEF